MADLVERRILDEIAGRIAPSLVLLHCIASVDRRALAFGASTLNEDRGSVSP